jgi:hypothetical protein
MTAGYLLDAVGLSIHASILAAAGLAAAIAALVSMPRQPDRPDRAASVLLVLVVAGVFAYAMRIAWPAFLPVTTGPDVVHHLQLIHFIARTGRLPHDPATAPLLAEMRGYTPGSHILAAAIGDWLRVDPLRVVYPLAALFVGIKAGMLYEVTRRLLDAAYGSLLALAAPLLVFVPGTFAVGALVTFFFYSQVLSETFAVGVLLFAIAWVQHGRWRDLVLASACALGVVLSWPIWIGPCAVAIAVALACRPLSWPARGAALVTTLLPAATFVAFHQWRNPGYGGIVAARGATDVPSWAALGPAFVVLAIGGALVALRGRGGRVLTVFLAAAVAQGVALALVAVRAGTGSPYMALKMVYLTVVPAAALAALALAWLARWLGARAPSRGRAVAACLPLAVAVLLVRGRVSVRPVHGSLSLDADAVGQWAGAHVPPGCIDYFSRYWLTGYWLHLDVLGNPRESQRMSHESFERADAIAKWIEGRGLPYAIVEDLASVPRDARVDMVPVYRSGAFALVSNRRPAACR